MSLLKFPGFIDVHVHLREPAATHKEDFYTGSRAALKGGFTFMLDMPNNPTPTISLERLEEKIELSKKALCDIGFHYGTNGLNIETFAQAAQNPKVFGLKLYCNHTTGEMLLENPVLVEQVFQSWPKGKPILVHAEGEQLAMAIRMAEKHDQRLHVCHITQASEVEMVQQAKKKGLQITAGVCPHHLFMTGADRETLGSLAMMKPPLGTQVDQDALWEGLNDGTIDVVETDHAPHTLEEKKGDPAPFGVPGLETAVGLLFKGVKDGKFPQEKMQTVFYDNAQKIFAIPRQEDTYIEIDPDKTWKVGEGGYETKCGWSPFEGWELPGVIEKVVLRGKVVVENQQVAVE
jgi:dihydroorotase-like cyclic amidohydrolase